MKAGGTDGWDEGRGSVAAPRWLAEVTPDDFVAELLGAGFARVTTAPSGRGKWFVATAVR